MIFDTFLLWGARDKEAYIRHRPDMVEGGSDGTASTMSGISPPEAREPEARDLVSQRADGTMGEEGGR